MGLDHRDRRLRRQPGLGADSRVRAGRDRPAPQRMAGADSPGGFARGPRRVRGAPGKSHAPLLRRIPHAQQGRPVDLGARRGRGDRARRRRRRGAHSRHEPRYHRAQGRREPAGRAARSVRAHCVRPAAGDLPRSHLPLRRGERRRLAVLDSDPRTRWSAAAPRGRAESAGGVLPGDRRDGNRPERGLVRHGGIPPRARHRHRYCDRSVVGGLPRAGRGARAAGVLVDAHYGRYRQGARHVGDVCPRTAPAGTRPRGDDAPSDARRVDRVAAGARG